MLKGLLSLVLFMSCSAVTAQTVTPRPTFDAFEVATIKPVASDPKASRYITMQGNTRFVEKDYTLKGLIAAAYNLNPHAISGGPDWMDAEHYDITAISPGSVRPTREEQMAMLRKLLEERFALAFHRESRDLSMFALKIAKGGSRLRENTNNQIPALVSMVYPQSIKLPARNVTMRDFASMLQRAIVDRPVVDQTGLTGKYDFDLEWAPDERQFNGEVPAASVEAPAPPLFAAVEQQLGLKLEPGRESVSALIVDRAARPSAN